MKISSHKRTSSNWEQKQKFLFDVKLFLFLCCSVSPSYIFNFVFNSLYRANMLKGTKKTFSGIHIHTLLLFYYSFFDLGPLRLSFVPETVNKNEKSFSFSLFFSFRLFPIGSICIENT